MGNSDASRAMLSSEDKRALEKENIVRKMIRMH